jgi:hypothetical protein
MVLSFLSLGDAAVAAGVARSASGTTGTTRMTNITGTAQESTIPVTSALVGTTGGTSTTTTGTVGAAVSHVVSNLALQFTHAHHCAALCPLAPAQDHDHREHLIIPVTDSD